jgi:hypothetical protein
MEENARMRSSLAAPALPTPVPPEGGEVVDAFSRIAFEIGSAASHGRMRVGQVRVPPGDGPPASTDRADDELFIVHQGRFGFWDGAALARHGQPEMGRIAEICREQEIVIV